MLDKTNYIITLSLNNKNNIKFYRLYDKIFMSEIFDSINVKKIYFDKNVKGIYIDENNIIITSILLNNKYIYLPDIDYNKNSDILTAIINREIYIEKLINKYSSENNNDKINNLLSKKNFPFKCINNKYISNLLNT